MEIVITIFNGNTSKNIILHAQHFIYYAENFYKNALNKFIPRRIMQSIWHKSPSIKLAGLDNLSRLFQEKISLCKHYKVRTVLVINFIQLIMFSLIEEKPLWNHPKISYYLSRILYL